MKRSWSLAMILGGIGLVIAGFIYDTMFAGIPYQDPPEMSARFARQAGIASNICELGIAVIVIGILALLIRRVFRSTMNRPLKWAMTALLLGIFLPASPSMYRGDGTPVGMSPGAILLISASRTAVSAIDVYNQSRDESAYDSSHFTEDTLIPLFEGLFVLLALFMVCLVGFVSQLRSSPFRIIAAIFILAGGICLIRHLYPGYPPLFKNGYMYYPGAYFLMAAFPMVSFALIRKPAKSSAPTT